MISMPFLNGSNFDEGTMRMMCNGAAIDGMNCTLLLVMWMHGLKALPACMVNSPHLRNHENAVVAAASKLSLLHRFRWVIDAKMCTRTSQVIGILGIRLHSPMYLLMPLMTYWSKGDSHAENGSPALTWADHRCITYDLIVLGWSLLAPPSQVTHSSSTV